MKKKLIFSFLLGGITFLSMHLLWTKLTASSSTHQEKILSGRVTRVLDGDTIELLTEAKKRFRIRLQFIDAPEKAQPFGQVSKKFLLKLIGGKRVQVLYRKRGRYGRILGRVLLHKIDIQLKEIQAGLAWHYRFFAKRFQNKKAFQAYALAEKNAHTQKLGLWIEKNPIPPWKWRRKRKKRKHHLRN